MTTTINRMHWDAVVAGTTGNPLAEEEILSFAEGGNLLVESAEGRLFVPRLENEEWTLVPVRTEAGVARWLGISDQEAHRLMVVAQAPAFAIKEPLFGDPKPLYTDEDVANALRDHSAQHGLTDAEAALMLGLVVGSYERIAENVRFRSEGRVLRELLEAYRNSFLPNDKIWSSRSSLLKEFVTEYSRANPKDQPLVLQRCDACDHVASDQCCNPSCREGLPSRYLCPAHAEWVDIADAVRRPPSLCPQCAVRVRAGELPNYRLL